MSKVYKVIFWVAVIGLTLFSPEYVYAQWPPFRFFLEPMYEAGKITYSIEFSRRGSLAMSDVTVRIPVPDGTRFVSASAEPNTQVNFDGAEVSFSTSLLDRGAIRGASFVVEVVDTAQSVFTTHAWIAWKGDEPGEYVTGDVRIDIDRLPLAWEEPASSRLQLEAAATVAGDVITYVIYPVNVGGLRMWDVEIRTALPEGTTFLSAEPAHPFVANLDQREVVFSALELARRDWIAPLKFQVSTQGSSEPLLTTHAWARWKNSGRRVGSEIVLQEENRTGDIIVRPFVSQQVASDMIGDVPFPESDLTAIALQPEQDFLKVTFYVVGAVTSTDHPLRFILQIDNDCRTDTGTNSRSRGTEYRARYDNQDNRASLFRWNATSAGWDHLENISSQVSGNTVSMWIPYNRLQDPQQFCWWAGIQNLTHKYNPDPPSDYIPGPDMRISQYQAAGAPAPNSVIVAVPEPAAKPVRGIFIDKGAVWRFWPGWSPPPDNWNAVDFDDTQWFSGATAIGYGSGNYATDLSDVTLPVQPDGVPVLVERIDERSGMTVAVLPSGDVGSVYLRQTFSVPDPAQVAQLNLEMDYRGSFVAYLNGVEVARQSQGPRNSPAAYDQPAGNSRVNTAETIDLSYHAAGLFSGDNVLAIEVHKLEDVAELYVTPRLAWSSERPVESDQPVVTPLPDEPITPAPEPSLSPPVASQMSGKVAIPLDNGRALYDVVIFSLPDGQEVARIANARQPNFRVDGQRVLINRQGGGNENLYEYDLATGIDRQVSDAPGDMYPTYDRAGNRVAYSNPEMLISRDGTRQPFIFVQCSLLPPHQETDPRCRDIVSLGVLVPGGQMGEIQGTHPVWTANDLIAYRGCNTWAGSRLCGIYIVPSASTKGLSDGFVPRQLTSDTSDTPSDSKGNLIAFSSRRDGDWEAYITDLDGAEVKNLSNSPSSNDGLPTISPDGNWAAFVSDRDGRWAIWAVPLAGGPAEKLFDLPVSTPWGDGDRTWLNERLSWGP